MKFRRTSRPEANLAKSVRPYISGDNSPVVKLGRIG
jgi:hypothetical protein